MDFMHTHININYIISVSDQLGSHTICNSFLVSQRADKINRYSEELFIFLLYK